MKEAVGDTGSGAVGLYMKGGVLQAHCLLALGVSQPWEKQSLQDSQDPGCQSIIKYRK